MKIGVVSDTHGLEIPKQIFDEFKNVDFVIHAGDFTTAADLKKFSDLKEVKAVYGNMDEPKLRQKLPEKMIFKVEGCAIGLFHGEGAPQHIITAVQNKFKGDQVDVIIFGHSHAPYNQKVDGVLFFNPGSPNDEIYAPYRSYGLLEIDGKNSKGKIIKVKD